METQTQSTESPSGIESTDKTGKVLEIPVISNSKSSSRAGSTRTFKRSESNSKRRPPKPLKRTRALKRHNIEFASPHNDHLGFIWAAYKRGAFEGQEHVESDLDGPQFGSALTNWIVTFQQSGNDVVTVLADTEHGRIPVALISIAYDTHRAYPHAVFFPEATARLRLEIGVKFLVELKKQHLVLIDAREATTGYFRHLCRYGLLRAVGKIRDYYAKGEDAMWFQSRGD